MARHRHMQPRQRLDLIRASAVLSAAVQGSWLSAGNCSFMQQQVSSGQGTVDKLSGLSNGHHADLCALNCSHAARQDSHVWANWQDCLRHAPPWLLSWPKQEPIEYLQLLYISLCLNCCKALSALCAQAV